MKILSRLAAVAVLAVPCAHWLVSSESAKMAQYKSLSHDALLAVLQEQHLSSLGLSYVGTVIVLGIVFGAVQGLGVAIERLAKFLRAG
jgi:hypothetical protein